MTAIFKADFSLPLLYELWPPESEILAVVLFGSRAELDIAEKPGTFLNKSADLSSEPVKEREIADTADWDVGVIFRGNRPELEIPENWDLFCWDEEKWEEGFALQLEIARTGQILFDPDEIVKRRFEWLKAHILPHFAGYLNRF